MRTFFTGAGGCLATISLEQWSQAAAIAAGFGTFAWMAIQCFIAVRRERAAAARVHHRKGKS